MNKLRILSLIPLTCLSINASANVVGSDAQNFNTITSGLDFVTVQSSETLEPCILNFGAFTNYAQNTFSYLGVPTKDGSNYKDGVAVTDFNVGFGLLKDWDVGASFPVLMFADDNGQGDRILLSNRGLTEVRLNTKYRFLGDQSAGLAAVVSTNFELIQNNPYTGDGAGPTFNFELAGDTTFSRVALGANLGYRLRNPGKKLGNFPIDPLKNQIIASIAASYLIPDSDLKVIGEIFSGFPAEKSNVNTDRTQTILESLLGAKYDATSALALHAGFGTRLATGIASPDWRVYVGLNYAVGPVCDQCADCHLAKAAPAPQFDAKPAPNYARVNIEDELIEQPTETFVTQDIHFKFDSDKVVEDGAKKIIQELYDHLVKSSFKKLVINGHTDSVGKDSYNLSLSQRRAASLRTYMIQKYKIDPKKIESQGFGESKPIADNGNYQGRWLNRRVEFLIYR